MHVIAAVFFNSLTFIVDWNAVAFEVELVLWTANNTSKLNRTFNATFPVTSHNFAHSIHLNYMMRLLIN